MGWSLLVSFVAIEVLIDRPDVKTFHFVSCGTSGSCQAAVGALDRTRKHSGDHGSAALYQ